MNKKIFIAILTAAAMLLSGCEKEDKDEEIAESTTTVTEVTTEKEPEVTTAETTVVETETEPPEIETETEPETTVETEPAVPGNNDSDEPMFGKASSWNYISNAKTGDGFITYDPDDITESITDVNMVEKRLNMEAMQEGSKMKTVYRFTLKNVASAGELNGMFMTTVVRDDGVYLVAFGKAGDTTLEEVLPYCSEGKEVEYWAFGELTDDGVPVLVPFIAGSENSGYYLIIPALEQFGQDIDGMTVPSSPIGRDVNIDEYTTTAAETTAAETTTASEKADGSVKLDITNIENGSLITTAECKIKNNIGKNIYLTGKKLKINGVDYSEKFTAFIEAGIGETVTDELFIDDVKINAGDKLEITFMVGDNDTYVELGELTFNMEIGATYY